jgi:hypothetical protein
MQDALRGWEAAGRDDKRGIHALVYEKVSNEVICWI